MDLFGLLVPDWRSTRLSPYLNALPTSLALSFSSPALLFLFALSHSRRFAKSRVYVQRRLWVVSRKESCPMPHLTHPSTKIDRTIYNLLERKFYLVRSIESYRSSPFNKLKANLFIWYKYYMMWYNISGKKFVTIEQFYFIRLSISYVYNVFLFFFDPSFRLSSLHETMTPYTSLTFFKKLFSSSARPTLRLLCITEIFISCRWTSMSNVHMVARLNLDA